MKHTRRSIRLPSYDYTSSGAYFITICTHNREHSFGEIINDKMKLSRIGEIVSNKWHDILNHDNHVDLGEFMVMPNHIHGIIWIVGTRLGVSENNSPQHHSISDNNVEKSLRMPEKNNNRIHQGESLHNRKFGKPQPGSLSMIINHFKASVKRWCNKNKCNYFRWQRNYYEHIIRNDDDLYDISEYIKTNPLHWEQDKEFKVDYDN
ncbi:MAG: transposase [Armatimonadetes bacterium]|nr:transposase [Armatimonadota bacterium]